MPLSDTQSVLVPTAVFPQGTNCEIIFCQPHSSLAFCNCLSVFFFLFPQKFILVLLVMLF